MATSELVLLPSALRRWLTAGGIAVLSDCSAERRGGFGSGTGERGRDGDRGCSQRRLAAQRGGVGLNRVEDGGVRAPRSPRMIAPGSARATAAGPRQHSRRQGRRLPLVARRHDPQRRPVTNQKGWGNVMYPAAPWCPRNEAYAANVREAFRTGSSPSDFPDENYERTWTNRFHPNDLNDTGRRGLGIE
jgi:hypothetical protein